MVLKKKKNTQWHLVKQCTFEVKRERKRLNVRKNNKN